jgi:SAM-dependent methyltransferase
MNSASEFDSHADSYDAELNQGLSVSGETKEYFATRRVHWLRQCLGKLSEQPSSAIDYGCGIGDTTVLLRNLLQLKSSVGLDVSARSLELARLNHASEGCAFLAFEEYIPKADVDLVYCNGVFHHIPIDARAAAVDYVLRCLRPGGLFAWWENNPWNPGTRYVMSRTAFDRNALTITASGATRLLQSRGFEVLTINYLFLFPRFLNALRFLEPYARGVPLGAQYQILCRKPGQPATVWNR